MNIKHSFSKPDLHRIHMITDNKISKIRKHFYHSGVGESERHHYDHKLKKIDKDNEPM